MSDSEDTDKHSAEDLDDEYEDLTHGRVEFSKKGHTLLIYVNESLLNQFRVLKSFSSISLKKLRLWINVKFIY